MRLSRPVVYPPGTAGGPQQLDLVRYHSQRADKAGQAGSGRGFDVRLLPGSEGGDPQGEASVLQDAHLQPPPWFIPGRVLRHLLRARAEARGRTQAYREITGGPAVVQLPGLEPQTENGLRSVRGGYLAAE